MGDSDRLLVLSQENDQQYPKNKNSYVFINWWKKEKILRIKNTKKFVLTFDYKYIPSAWIPKPKIIIFNSQHKCKKHIKILQHGFLDNKILAGHRWKQWDEKPLVIVKNHG